MTTECRVSLQVEGVAEDSGRGSICVLCAVATYSQRRRKQRPCHHIPNSRRATMARETSAVPSFHPRRMGLVREARFIQNSDGSPDGGSARSFH